MRTDSEEALCQEEMSESRRVERHTGIGTDEDLHASTCRAGYPMRAWQHKTRKDQTMCCPILFLDAVLKDRRREKREARAEERGHERGGRTGKGREERECNEVTEGQ